MARRRGGEAHLREREHDSNDGLEFKPNFRRRPSVPLFLSFFLSGGDEMSEFSLLQKVAASKKDRGLSLKMGGRRMSSGELRVSDPLHLVF